MQIFMIIKQYAAKETTRSQMPHRGLTAVASRFNGWETAENGGACRRYATHTAPRSRT